RRISATSMRHICLLSFLEPKYQHLPDCQVPGECLVYSRVSIAYGIGAVFALGVSGAGVAVSGIVSSAT
ncbi:MAG: hypothetical protein ACI9LY_003908, partial [Arenicella sp.]